MRETTPVRPLEGAAARAGQVHTGQGQVDLVKVTDMKNAIKLWMRQDICVKLVSRL